MVILPDSRLSDPPARKLLILDLDETLIHATKTALEQQADFRVYKYHVYKRPHLDLFLQSCFEWFTVAVWTSASPDYAAEIVSTIFLDPSRLAFVWDRRRCSSGYDYDLGEYYTRKPLKKVKRRGYRSESVLAVDDTPQKWTCSYGNLVPIKPFEGDIRDDELRHLIVYLEKIKNEPNIRKLEKRFWRQSVTL
jgi:TFIIF-interacting CTD phosphatase-like protein